GPGHARAQRRGGARRARRRGGADHPRRDPLGHVMRWLPLLALVACTSSEAQPTPKPAPAPKKSPDQKWTYNGTAMGTVVSVFIWGDDEAKAAKGAQAVFDEMKRLDGVMTTWTNDSEVSKINTAAGDKPVEVSEETYEVIARAVDV